MFIIQSLVFERELEPAFVPRGHLPQAPAQREVNAPVVLGLCSPDEVASHRIEDLHLGHSAREDCVLEELLRQNVKASLLVDVAHVVSFRRC